MKPMTRCFLWKIGGRRSNSIRMEWKYAAASAAYLADEWKQHDFEHDLPLPLPEWKHWKQQVSLNLPITSQWVKTVKMVKAPLSGLRSAPRARQGAEKFENRSLISHKVSIYSAK